MPKVLFVHNGSPGRFAFVAEALIQRGWTGLLINGPEGRDLPGLATARWDKRLQATGAPIARNAETAFQRGEIAAAVAADLKRKGFAPDLIIGHPAWGEMLFLAQIFPGVPQIQVGELFFRPEGQHLGFDPEFPATDRRAAMAQHAGNAAQVLSYTDASRIVVPTPFQARSYPPAFLPQVRVIHEGVDTKIARPIADVQLRLADGTPVDASGPVVTFVNRRFEPLRGFHIFMRALPRFLASVPEARVVLVGQDGHDTYGPSPKEGSWKQVLLDEVGARLDLSRVHFVGSLPYEKLVRLFSISAAHVHFSYPTILSWSLLDAMACECLVLGSDTASIRDVVRHGENGLLIDFFDVEGLATAMADACLRPDAYRPLRTNARQSILSGFDRASVCLPQWLALIDELVPDP